MSQHRPPRLPQAVLAELQGLDWKIERGAKHWLLIIGGRQVLVFGQRGLGPASGDYGSTQNFVSAIRRFKRAEARP